MNFKNLFIPAAFLLVCSCSEEITPQGQSDELKLRVSLNANLTKTCLDPDESALYRPVYWCDGDVVNVNGSASKPLVGVGGMKMSSAEFCLQNVSAPYSIVYPDGICGEYAEDGTISLEIPSVQEYDATSFGSGAAVLYGYAESDDAPASLKNLCGAVRVPLKDGAQAKISRATLVCNDENAAVAGKFSLDPRTGEYKVVEGVDSLTLAFTEIPLASDKGSSFYFAVPYGSYPGGFTVKFYDSKTRLMECTWVKGTGMQEGEPLTIEAGRLYDFNPVEFEPVTETVTYIWAADGNHGFVTGTNKDHSDLSWNDNVVSQTFRAGTPALKWNIDATASAGYNVSCVDVSESVATKRIKFGSSPNLFNPVKFTVTPADGFDVESITAYVSVNKAASKYTITAKVGDTVFIDNQAMVATKNPAAFTGAVETPVPGDVEITIGGATADVFYLYRLEIVMVK